MFEMTAGLLAPLYYGITICFGRGIKHISNDVKRVKPAVLVLVPMVVEGIYKRICLEISKSGNEKSFRRAIKLSNILRKFNIDLRSVLFKKIQESFGGKLRIVVCGGAYLDPDLVERFDELGISLRNGYGISECSPVVACNMEKKSKAGSAGFVAPSPYCEVKIVESEIYVRGTIVTQGYYQDAEATDQAFEEGWFKTGDLGYLDDEGFLFITGRKKNLIVLSDGNNISPEELEFHLEKIELISSVFVCDKKHHHATLVTACIYPDFEYAESMGVSDIKQKLEDEIQKINAIFPLYKRIQNIEIFDEDFSKTALGKIKRYAHSQ
jgi:long-chain acyl-CoA synthetase